MLFNTVIATLALVASAQFPFGYKNCGNDATDAISLSGVSLSPAEPKSGDTMHVTVSGKLLKEITQGAKARITAKIGALTVKTDILDTCELAVKQGLGPCPLKVDAFPDSLTQVVDYLVPDDVPKGVTFTLRVETLNGDGKSPVSCFTGPMKIAEE